MFHGTPAAGHFGAERTLTKVAARYFWPSMRRDVKQFVAVCIDCQRYKPIQRPPAQLFPMEKATAEATVTLLVNEVCYRFGTPRLIISDQGTQLSGHLLLAVCELMGIKHEFSLSYHLLSNVTNLNSFSHYRLAHNYLHLNYAPKAHTHLCVVEGDSGGSGNSRRYPP